jgi:hypothetical protein
LKCVMTRRPRPPAPIKPRLSLFEGVCAKAALLPAIKKTRRFMGFSRWGLPLVLVFRAVRAGCSAPKQQTPHSRSGL